MKLIRRPLSLLVLLIVLAVPHLRADELLVFAASSLRQPFIEIGQAYENETGQKVTFNFSGSQTLRTQIEFGAPADLFAAANPEIIKELANRNLVETVHYFASNRLIVLIAHNSRTINRLDDLRQPGLQLAIGNNQVPIGIYTQKLLADMAADPQFGPDFITDIRRNVRTEESSVKAVAAKIVLGEVDAGIVYQSDLNTDVRKKTTHLELPHQHNPFVRYPAAVVSSSRNTLASRRFLDFLLAPISQKIMHQHGFLPVGLDKMNGSAR